MVADPPAEASNRHALFEAARHSAGWTVEQLWVHYVGLGGVLVVFDIEAFLAGLTLIPAAQQDVLACALNEQLADLHHNTRVPYLIEAPEWLEEHLSMTAPHLGLFE